MMADPIFEQVVRSIGTIVIDELIVPVISIEMVAGGFLLVGEITPDRDVTVNPQGDVQMFAPSGELVCSYPSAGITSQVIVAGETARFRVPIQFFEQRGWRE